MRKLRVLVVDDSVVIRRMLTDILSEDPQVEVVGVAGSGAIALAKIPLTHPDIVTLDIEMPDMDGLETLTAIRRLHPGLPVIMFSSLTERAASTTLEALARGATDYVTKPAATGSREASIEHVRAQLLPRLRALGMRSLAGNPSLPVDARSSAPGAPDSRRVATARVEVLVVAASTGGPNAIAEVFARIPKSLSVPVVIVQHMPPVFTQLFADRLSSACPLNFSEAKGGEALAPGQAYVAPGDYHMRLVRDGTVVRVALDQGPQEQSCRPAADVLIRSTVDIYGPGTLAVVLTGMGQDGLKGCTQVRARGGQVIVQDEASSIVWGMPGFVANAKLAHAVLPLSEIADEIMRRVAPPVRARVDAHGSVHHVA
jgi:two-component system, chemotaxis family, protein-glutamate methylesterase/glutaminase